MHAARPTFLVPGRARGDRHTHWRHQARYRASTADSSPPLCRRRPMPDHKPPLAGRKGHRAERKGGLCVSSGARTRSTDDSQLLASSAYALPTHTLRMPRPDAVLPRAHFGKSAILVTFVLPLPRCCFCLFGVCRFFQHPLLPLLRCRKHIIATISDHRAPSVHTSDCGAITAFFRARRTMDTQ